MTKPLAFGSLMFDVAGTHLEATDIARLQHPACAGVILFSRNYTDPEQLQALTAHIKALRPELLIAVDHEGGRVQRFRNGLTRLPPAALYADCSDTEISDAGWLMAAELRALGVDFSFAPVLDVDCGISAIIGDRAFARDPETVTRAALAWMQGMHQAGMAATGKHFPGHGGVAHDSHATLPVDARSLESLLSRDLVPFDALIAAGLEAIMPAHVVYPAADTQPAGFSRYWLQTQLAGRMGFRGTVFSDDLSMEGAAGVGGYCERAWLSLEAGCHVLLVCNQPAATDDVLTWLETYPVTTAQSAHLARMRGRGTVKSLAQLQTDERWLRTRDFLAARVAAAVQQGVVGGIAVGEKEPA